MAITGRKTDSSFNMFLSIKTKIHPGKCVGWGCYRASQAYRYTAHSGGCCWRGEVQLKDAPGAAQIMLGQPRNGEGGETKHNPVIIP